MEYQDFIKSIKDRANLQNEQEVLKAVEATFTTLSERMAGKEAENLGSQLPRQVQQYLTGAVDNMGHSFGVDEFFRRVAQKEGVDLAIATQHAQVVMWVVSESVTRGELNDVRHHFPASYAPLFEFVGRGLPNSAQEARNQPF